MKNFLFYLVLLAVVQNVNGQIPSSCIQQPVLQNYYDRDVKHLALKRIFDLGTPAMDSIIIPQSYQDTIWQGLAAIFNLTAFPARDSVFDIYCIHQYASDYIFYEITVTLEPTCAWYQQWQNLITATGVPALDTLLSTYGFTVTDFWPIINAAVLTTTQTINVKPLCDSIATFEGVVYSEPDPMSGDGDKINYTKAGSIRYLDFSVGYGDCMAGCDGSRTYQYQVNEDCSVQYLGSYLDPAEGYTFPPPVNCYITLGTEDEKKNTGFRIFPNPADNVLNIETDLLSLINFSVLNSHGQVMKTGLLQGKATISTGDLPPGLYVLLFYDVQGREHMVKKFTKK